MNEKDRAHADVIAVDKMGGKVLFIDAARRATVAVLDDFAPVPHELLLSRDHAIAYVPIYGAGIHGNNPNPGHLVSIVDITLRRHIRDIDISPLRAPHGMLHGPDGLIYITCENSGVIALLDPVRATIVGTIDAQSRNCHRLMMLPDGSRIYTENEEDACVSVLDVKRRCFLRHIATPRPLAGIAAAFDGRAIVAVDDEQPAFFVIDPKTDRIVHEVKLNGHREAAQIARYSPDGRYLLITSLKEGVVTLLNAELSEQKTFRVGEGPMDAAFHD
ncbi:MAG: hypothetical protein HY659_07915, partial [Rhizobiales bacterium]|nr:hypothetical protein [Hyphomicrobiales bacterium]